MGRLTTQNIIIIPQQSNEIPFSRIELVVVIKEEQTPRLHCEIFFGYENIWNDKIISFFQISNLKDQTAVSLDVKQLSMFSFNGFIQNIRDWSFLGI